MSKIGLIDVDGKGSAFPNLALMKISAYHKAQGDEVEWASALFGGYDKVYKSKVFNFSPDDNEFFDCPVECGGTGYDITKALPDAIDRMTPDYSIYPSIGNKTAYGFLTRGCVNKCKWCVVPRKEGAARPYMDVEEIAVDGRTNLILMDNNVLATDYGLEQIKKIIRKGYRVDFNQALDARLITPDIAKMLAQVKWLSPIRLGCDTPKQVEDCERAMALIDKHRKTPAQYLLYTMLGNDINEAYNRLSHWRDYRKVRLVAQPYRDPDAINTPPQWQLDMARWAMRRELYASCDFKDFKPRKGVIGENYFRINL